MIDAANLPLVFAPESGNMLGGTIVNITGPCFQPDDRIRCKFDVESEVVGYVVDTNRAICVQPRLFAEGWVNLQIAIGPNAFKWKGKYYVGAYFHYLGMYLEIIKYVNNFRITRQCYTKNFFQRSKISRKVSK